MTNKVKHKSGYEIHADIQYHQDIGKYYGGLIIVNLTGMRTSRIATQPIPFASEKEAADFSIEVGKEILLDHLNNKSPLDFY